VDLQGPNFYDFRDLIFSEFRDPMIIFSDSVDLNRALKHFRKTLVQFLSLQSSLELRNIYPYVQAQCLPLLFL